MAKHRILANVVIMASGQAGTLVLSFVYFAALGRYLGPRGLGQLSLATAIVTVISLFVGMGLQTWVLRSVARDPDRGATYASSALLIRTLIALPTPLFLFAYSSVVPLDPVTRSAAYVLLVNMIFTALSGALVSAFQGRELMSYGALGAVVQNVLALGLAVLLIRLRAGVVPFAVATSVVSAVVFVLYLVIARRIHLLTRRLRFGDIRGAVTGSVAFWANAVFLTIYFYIDSLILGYLAGEAAVGFYAAPNRLFSVAMYMPSIVSLATLPLLSRLGQDATNGFGRASRKTISLLIIAAVPMTVGMATLSGLLVTRIFGPDYGPSGPVLAVLALALPFTFLNVNVSNALAARDQQWRWSAVMGASVILNPLVNLVTIPYGMQHWHNGALGAAVALLATEILMAAYGTFSLRDVVVHIEVGRTVAVALVGAAVQWAIVWASGAIPILVGEAGGAVAYVAVVLLGGIVPREDLILMLQVTRRRSRQASAGS